MVKKYPSITLRDHQEVLKVVPSEILKHFFSLLYETGIRPADALVLTAENIDRIGSQIIYAPMKYSGKMQSRIPITENIEKILLELPSAGALFPTLSSYSTAQIARMFRSFCRAAGLHHNLEIHSYRLTKLREYLSSL